MAAIFTIKSFDGEMQVFEDKVTLRPSGVFGFIAKGIKGTKEIPFRSITAIQYKAPGFANRGYLQFTLPGGIESRGGLFDATKDENTFMFNAPQQAEVERAKAYVESRMKAPASVSAAPDLASQLARLAELKASGALSDVEFTAAKRRLIG